jgi:DNA-binding GntR family transcriptional regulator
MSGVSQTLVDRVKSSMLRHAGGSGSITEQTLCRELKVGRGAVREALAELQKQGLIERRRKKGTSIRKPSLKELIDLWDTRCALEGMAARLACANISDADIKTMHDLCASRRLAADNGDQRQVDQEDIAFHEYIIAVCGNNAIREIIQSAHLFDRIFRFTYPVPNYWPQDEDTSYGHEKIIETLAARDPDGAEDVVKRHIQEGKKRRIESLIGKLNLFE